VAFGFDFGEDFDEGLVGADEERRPLDADDFLAVHVLFLENPKLFADFFVYICKEWIRQVVLGLEFGLGFGRVAGDAEDDGSGVLELFEGVAEAAGFDGAAGGIGPGIEEEDNGLAGEVAEMHGLILVVLNGEVGNFLVKFHKSSFERRESRAACAASYRLLLRRLVMSRSRERGLKMRRGWVFAGLALGAGLLVPAHAQYPGRVNPNQGAAAAPVLRSTAVLEYTGDLTKPTAVRLVPIAVWDGERYQPGGLYMAQPMPMAVASGTVYELLDAGTSKGLFDVKAAANVSGSWVATGSYQKPPAPKVSKLKPSKALPQFTKDVDYDDGKPHFAHRPPAEAGSGSGSGSGSGTGTSSGSGSGSGSGSSTSSSAPAASDSDRPTLHRRTDSSSDGQTGTGSGSSTGSGGASSTAGNAPEVDPDRPTLHRKTDSSPDGQTGSSSGSGSGSGSGSSTSSSPSDTDPDRPTLHRHTEATTNPNDNGAPVSATMNIDPNRPRLQYGKPTTPEALDVPTTVQIAKLAGSPENVKLMAAVSDAKSRAPHSYVYSWSNPDDATKMQAALEDVAKHLVAGKGAAAATGQTKPVQTGTKPAAKTAQAGTRTATASHTAHKTALKPVLPDLTDEEFKAYELSFGGGATLVFTARTAGEGDAVKYVTIIAQPDFNGVPQILFKQVTSAAGLDVTPRMRLVDAVDTDADNRAELIFELAGKTDRQFAIYRVHDRTVEQVFSTAGSQ
jgi:hypothetical protein